MCDSVDAFDGSFASLMVARRTALEEGLAHRIRYFAADFNEPALPSRQYDLVLFHQSAHHVAKLEKLFRAVMRAMTDDAMLYLDEYVGPSRHDWNDDVIAVHRRAFASLPATKRRIDRLSYPIQDDDPSEAIRSSEIEPQLRVGFRVVARRPYGGTLLSVVFPSLRRETLTDEEVQRLIETENEMLSNGARSYYALIVATPRRGLAGAYARAHYFAVPKVKRVLRELRARI